MNNQQKNPNLVNTNNLTSNYKTLMIAFTMNLLNTILMKKLNN